MCSRMRNIGYMFFIWFSLLAAACSALSNSTTSEEPVQPKSTGFIIAAGGSSGNNCVKSVFALNLESGDWNRLPDLPEGRSDLGIVENMGKVYAIGGRCGSAGYRSTFVLSIPMNRWERVSPLDTSGMTAAVSFNSSIYILGGSSTSSKQFRIMDAGGVWKIKPNSSLSHAYSRAAVVNEHIYACRAGLSLSKECEYFDTTNQTWHMIPEMNIFRAVSGAVFVDGYFYMIGGFNGVNERYDPTTKKWSFVRSMITNPRFGAAVTTDGKHIYVIGGIQKFENGTEILLDSVEKYFPCSDTWLSLSSYPASLKYTAAVYVQQLPVNCN